MCAGLMFQKSDGSEFKVYFPIPLARIPFITKNGEQLEGIWGRRNKNEFKGENIPVTGWAKIESLKNGKWDKYKPEKVYIPALKYMEKDHDRNSHWFELAEKTKLIGIKLTIPDFNVIYMATRPTPKEFSHIHDRWVMFSKGE